MSKRRIEMTKVVHVTVQGGVVQHVEVPRGVTVILRDYDVDGWDQAVLNRDDNGDHYFEAIWEGEP